MAVPRDNGPPYATDTDCLRRKIEADPAHPRYLITEPGIGCRLALG
jgi:two-component system KDP operon response regulator KdpE